MLEHERQPNVVHTPPPATARMNLALLTRDMRNVAVLFVVWAGLVWIWGGAGLFTPGFGDAFAPVTGLLTAFALLQTIRSVDLQGRAVHDTQEALRLQQQVVADTQAALGLQRQALEKTQEALELQRREFELTRSEVRGQRQAQEEQARIQQQANIMNAARLKIEAADLRARARESLHLGSSPLLQKNVNRLAKRENAYVTAIEVADEMTEAVDVFLKLLQEQRQLSPSSSSSSSSSDGAPDRRTGST